MVRGSSSSAPLVLAAAPWHHQLMPRAAAGTFLRAPAGAGVRVHSTRLPAPGAAGGRSGHRHSVRGQVQCQSRLYITWLMVTWLDTSLKMFDMEGFLGWGSHNKAPMFSSNHSKQPGLSVTLVVVCSVQCFRDTHLLLLTPELPSPATRQEVVTCPALCVCVMLYCGNSRFWKAEFCGSG